VLIDSHGSPAHERQPWDYVGTTMSSWWRRSYNAASKLF